MARRNNRRHDRNLVDVTIRIGWRNEAGMELTALTRSFDISTSGMRFEMFERISLRTDVMLRGDKIGLQTRATVRHCAPKGNRYAIGVEFAGGYRWSPPNDEVRRILQEAEMLSV